MSGNLPVALPFALATLYYLFTPFFSALTQSKIRSHLEEANAQWQPSVNPDTPPQVPHLSPQSIAQLADWTADAPQFVPTILLPLAGVLFSVSTSQNAATSVAVFASLLITIGALWIYHEDPVKYSKKTIASRYTLVAVLGVVLNLLATCAVLFLPPYQA